MTPQFSRANEPTVPLAPIAPSIPTMAPLPPPRIDTKTQPFVVPPRQVVAAPDAPPPRIELVTQPAGISPLFAPPRPGPSTAVQPSVTPAGGTPRPPAAAPPAPPRVAGPPAVPRPIGAPGAVPRPMGAPGAVPRPPGAPAAKRTETAIELTYRVQAKDWLTLQPDLQYVIHPNGDHAIGNALVIGLRLNVNLTRNLIRQVKGEAP